MKRKEKKRKGEDERASEGRGGKEARRGAREHTNERATTQRPSRRGRRRRRRQREDKRGHMRLIWPSMVFLVRNTRTRNTGEGRNRRLKCAWLFTGQDFPRLLAVRRSSFRLFRRGSSLRLCHILIAIQNVIDVFRRQARSRGERNDFRSELILS